MNIYIFWPMFSFEAARSEKDLNIFALFKNFKNQNLHFWILSKSVFRNGFHAPFLPYFDGQHFTELSL